MELKNTLIALLSAATLSAMAIPAKHGAVYQMLQPDGSTVSLQIVGDEHAHYYLTTDDKVVISAGLRYCYATTDSYGNLVNTEVLAHNPIDRQTLEAELVKTLDGEKAKSAIFARSQAMARSNSQDGKGGITSTFPTKGNVKTVVFLVSYSDVPFTIEDPADYFNRMLSEEGFASNNGKGSCRDYFIDASAGQFVPEFDVYGPIELPNPREYYGANTTMYNDARAKEMVLHAAQQLDETTDFSQYDLDGDGFIDNVYIFYAGLGEADGGDANCVWPHQSTIGYNSRYRFDGVQFNRYACGAELSGSKPAGIGTFCHEFSHVLGLPDLYNTDDTSVNYTPLNYSIMDQGCYNSDGTQPPTFSAYERNVLGWMGDDLVEITDAATCSLEHILDSNKAYLINTDNDNEFFIFENRQQKGWDSSLYGHGMLVWHIDYDKKTFNSNLTNAEKDHQRVDIIEANGATGFSFLIQRKYPFPGASNKTKFTFDSAPSFKAWSGYDMELPITDIAEQDGIVTFNVKGGGPDPAGITDVLANDGTIKCEALGRRIYAASNGLLTICDLSGRIIARGSDSLDVEVSSPGLYIVASPAGSMKVIVK